MNVHMAGDRERLERAEAAYADATDGEALVVHEETGTVKWHMADGGEAKSLDDAVRQAEALVRFTQNQRKGN